MIYRAVEQAYAVLNTNLAAYYAAAAAAKSVTVTPVAMITKRHDAETFVRLNADVTGKIPWVGVYGLKARTQPKHQARRYTDSVIVYDYFGPHTDPVKAQQQAEIVAEAFLRTIDRLWNSTAGMSGAGEAPRSIEIDFDPGFEELDQQTYNGRVRVAFQVTDHDDGL